jgi:hypothetical protein
LLSLEVLLTGLVLFLQVAKRFPTLLGIGDCLLQVDEPHLTLPLCQSRKNQQANQHNNATNSVSHSFSFGCQKS